MTAISVSAFSKHAEQYIARAIENQDIIHVTTEEGSAVLIGEEEFRGMLETLRLMNAEGMPERVAEARRTPIEESEDFSW